MKQTKRTIGTNLSKKRKERKLQFETQMKFRYYVELPEIRSDVKVD